MSTIFAEILYEGRWGDAQSDASTAEPIVVRQPQTG